MEKRSTRIATVLFLIYIVLLVWIILFKLQFSIADLDTVRSVNLVPFHYDKEIGAAFHLKEVIENLLIFVPLGIYLQILLPKSKFHIKLIIIIGICLLLETVQYILSIGRSDITDLIMNTMGGLLGLSIYCIVTRLLKDRKKADKLFLFLAVVVSIFIIGLLAFLLLLN